MQPEAKFKKAIREGFEHVMGGAHAEDSYLAHIVAGPRQKRGLPDLFASAWGSSSWIEAKIVPNGLSAIQEHVQGRMARAGTRIWKVSGEDTGPRAKRRVFLWLLVPRISGEGAELVPNATEFLWSDLKAAPFWHTIIGAPR